MPLTQDDWREIQALINKVTSQVGEAFVQGVVVKSDPVRKVVWLKEFGDVPIPIIAFDYQMKYQDKRWDNATTSNITEIKKTKPYSTEVEVLVPRVGDLVLVAQQFGSRRLPKCLGVIKSKRYIEPSGD